jgi:hypothetical protein
VGIILTIFKIATYITHWFEADLQEYYAIQSQHKSWDKIIKNRHIIPDFPREDAVATFRLITAHDCLAAHLHIL